MSYRTHLYRYIQSTEKPGRYIIQSYRDEFRKITLARWKLIGIMKGKIKDFDNYIWKLDGRSVRYMRNKIIIENKKHKLVGEE